MATGLRAGWGSLFLSDEKVYDRSGAELLSIVKNVTGSGDAVAKKISTTFRALADKATWEGDFPELEQPNENERGTSEATTETQAVSAPGPTSTGTLRLHHDIHLHLPPTSDVGVYRAIFQAMKSELM